MILSAGSRGIVGGSAATSAAMMLADGARNSGTELEVVDVATLLAEAVNKGKNQPQT